MHEHLSPFGGAGGGCIINMNGRVYDPLTASFFSPDPFVQAPGNWLNYNRYAYCYGNPFKYTDPDGEWILSIICAVVPGAQAFLPYAAYVDAALWGGTMNVISNWDDISKNGSINSEKFWSYAGLGVVNGVGVATGNVWVMGATGLIESGGNRFIKDNYKFSDQVIWDGLYGASSAMLMHKLTAPIEATGFETPGWDLDGKIQQLLQKGLSERTSKYIAKGLITFGYTYLSETVYNKYVARDDDFLTNPLQTALTTSLFSLGSEVLQDISSDIILNRMNEQKFLQQIDQNINSSYKYQNSGLYREFGLELSGFRYQASTYMPQQFNFQLFNPYKTRNIKLFYKRNK